MCVHEWLIITLHSGHKIVSAQRKSAKPLALTWQANGYVEWMMNEERKYFRDEKAQKCKPRPQSANCSSMPPYDQPLLKTNVLTRSRKISRDVSRLLALASISCPQTPPTRERVWSLSSDFFGLPGRKMRQIQRSTHVISMCIN